MKLYLRTVTVTDDNLLFKTVKFTNLDVFHNKRIF